MIETVKNAELKENKETLLKNMKMLRHTIADMLGSKSFFQGLEPGAQNGVITVNGEQFPVYITANTLGTDGVLISDDIFDEENYLSLVSDDDLFWYALVEHLAHQIDLLNEDNIKYSDDLVAANEEMDKLNCKIAEEIKARQGYEESLKQLREELTAADNEIEGLEESLREANKKCTEYVNDIDKLEVDNKRLNERVKTLVIEKSGKLENSDDTTEKPASEIVKECVDKPDLAEKYEELQEKNRILKWSYNNLRSVFNSTYGVNVANDEDMQQTITQETMAELTAKINELETTIKDKDERINQMSKTNAALSVENKNIGELLREADRNVRFYVREVDSLEKEIKDLQAKALSDGEDVIMDNKPEKFGEATRAGEAFAQSIEMDMETAMLLQENTKLKEQIENLQKDNEDFERVAAAHLETTTKFADYKERQKRLYKHFRNLAEMIEDLMEMG